MIALFVTALLATAVAQATSEPTTTLEPTASPTPTAVATPAAAPADDEEDLAGAVEELQEQVRALKKSAASTAPGDTAFVLSGYGFSGYTDAPGAPSSFNAGFNPIFLWRPSPRILFEGEIEIELEEGESHFELEYADVAFILHDLATLEAGKFLTPFGIYFERLHPAWITKLPEAPMAFGHAGLAPSTTLGAQVRGGIPLGPVRVGYALYVANGPALDIGSIEPMDAGTLSAENFDDTNDNKAAGGRIAVLPIPALEIGYSALTAQVSAIGTSREEVGVLVQGADLSFTKAVALLRGVIDFRAEAVRSQMDRATYDPDGTLGFGPVTFDNLRTSGYAQLAWRPSGVGPAFVRKLEVVARWDRLDLPTDAPDAMDETRVTGGLNYWITPSIVLKGAYRSSERTSAGTTQRGGAVLSQLAIGF